MYPRSIVMCTYISVCYCVNYYMFSCMLIGTHVLIAYMGELQGVSLYVVFIMPLCLQNDHFEEDLESIDSFKRIGDSHAKWHVKGTNMQESVMCMFSIVRNGLLSHHRRWSSNQVGYNMYNVLLVLMAI